MLTKFDILISTEKERYELNIERKVSIIQGESATGKTMMWSMIQSKGSGVKVECPYTCRVLSDTDSWFERISKSEDEVWFIDEDFPFIKSKRFAEAVCNSKACFVIITRWCLHRLPYSYLAVYELVFDKVYNSYKNIRRYDEFLRVTKTKKVITEDKKAGYDFFSRVYEEAESGVVKGICQRLQRR